MKTTKTYDDLVKVGFFTILLVIALAIPHIAIPYILKEPHQPYNEYMWADYSRFDMKKFMNDNGYDSVKIYEKAIADHHEYDEGSVPCIYATNTKTGKSITVIGNNVTVKNGEYYFTYGSDLIESGNIPGRLIPITDLNPDCKMFENAIVELDKVMEEH